MRREVDNVFSPLAGGSGPSPRDGSMGGASRRKCTVATARRLRKDIPLAEVRLCDALRGRRDDGLKFGRQHPEPPSIVDFVERGAKLAIEVDGWTHSTDEERAHDALRSENLAGKGWTLVRFENDDVYEHLSDVVCQIVELATRLKDHSRSAANPPSTRPAAGPLPPASGEKTIGGQT